MEYISIISKFVYSNRYHVLSDSEARPYDLHVLGTPPAFILSQDQTLIYSLLNTPGVSSCLILYLTAFARKQSAEINYLAIIDSPPVGGNAQLSKRLSAIHRRVSFHPVKCLDKVATLAIRRGFNRVNSPLPIK